MVNTLLPYRCQEPVVVQFTLLENKGKLPPQMAPITKRTNLGALRIPSDRNSTFYHAVQSQSGTVNWMLQELGIPFDVKLIDIRGGAGKRRNFWHSIRLVKCQPSCMATLS